MLLLPSSLGELPVSRGGGGSGRGVALSEAGSDRGGGASGGSDEGSAGATSSGEGRERGQRSERRGLTTTTLEGEQPQLSLPPSGQRHKKYPAPRQS